ncbi:MAG: DNA-binding response regulator [Acidobacteria bacterium]|nr:MAG: DNA-binding response regulator [Acidobacteriota bacterium]REK08425.1 MAG: DNA-binding response regulator [Acidobacteriota bacterium]
MKSAGAEKGHATAGAESACIAVVEDDETLRASLAFALEAEGYRVLEFPDGQVAWETLEQRIGDGRAQAGPPPPPDLVVLDVMMPRMDGLELCRRLRGRSEELPIFFLTSRDEEFDRVLGLELGADDYLCKPFSMRELLARVKVLLRRLQLIRAAAAGGGAEAVDDGEELVEVGPLTLDLRRYQATWRGQALGLTITEFQILCALARRPGHVKTRAQLMAEGYPHDNYVSERTIDTHVKRLRRKLEARHQEFDALETVYGVGYRWREDVAR